MGDGTVCGLIQIPAAPFVFILSLLMHEVQIKVNPDWFHTSAEVSGKKKVRVERQMSEASCFSTLAGRCRYDYRCRYLALPLPRWSVVFLYSLFEGPLGNIKPP